MISSSSFSVGHLQKLHIGEGDIEWVVWVSCFIIAFDWIGSVSVSPWLQPLHTQFSPTTLPQMASSLFPSCNNQQQHDSIGHKPCLSPFSVTYSQSKLVYTVHQPNPNYQPAVKRQSIPHQNCQTPRHHPHQNRLPLLLICFSSSLRILLSTKWEQSWSLPKGVIVLLLAPPWTEILLCS